jgi:hypothetical protein
VNDEGAEAQKARVMGVYERWAGPLGLGWQRQISFSWYRGEIPDHPRAAMTCEVQWQYKSARICVDLLKVADLTDDDLEWVVVHELMHVFLGGLIEAFNLKVDGDAFRMIEEHTASSLAQSVMWLRAHCDPKEKVAA